LDVDLTVAAAAVDNDRLDVAADVIDHDRVELMDFAVRADRHLEAAASEAQAEADADAEAAGVAAEISAPSRRRRRAVLSASQAVLAAAACAVVFAGVVPSGNSQPTHPLAGAQLEASYAEFTHLARTSGDAQRIVAAGTKLNRSIELRMTLAASDPARARQMLRILQEEQRLLRQMNPAGSARLIAQAQALLLRLTAALDEATSGEIDPGTSTSTEDEPAAPTPVGAPSPTAEPPTGEPTAEPTTEPLPTETPSGEPTTATIEPEPQPSTTGYPFPFGVGFSTHQN
jgi:hypothetical protein